MKKMMCVSILAAVVSAQDLAFTQDPQMARVNDTCWRIEFTVNKVTDVAVSIVNPADSSVVCHLAAGVLGANVPAPLIKDSLHQVLFWDGRDDLFKPVVAPESLRLRVRAGMSVGFGGMSVDDLDRFNSLDGMATDSAGNLYLYGCVNTLGIRHIRMYGPDGAYIRTLFPYPAGLERAEATDYGVNFWQNSTRYTPKVVYMRFPHLAPVQISQEFSYNTPAAIPATLAADAVAGKLCVVSRNALNVMFIKTNGGLAGPDDPLPLAITPSPGPATDACKGPLYVRFSQDGATAFTCGLYSSAGGFWLATKVMRVDVATGAARVMVNGTGQLGGIALDDSGHVFVCEPAKSRVAVYDTSGALLDSIPFANADQVEVNRKTGEIYVVTKAGGISIRKFANFKSGNKTAVASLENVITADISADRIYFALGQGGSGAPVVWLGNHYSGMWWQNADLIANHSVWGYRDDGDHFTLVKNFSANNRSANTGFDRIAVDPRTETVFIQDSWNKIFKVEDWNNPKVERCSTTTGPLWGTDMTVGPNNRLYVREGQSYSGPLTLYTMEHRHRFLKTLIADVYSRYGAGYGERGVGVGRDGRIGVLYMDSWANYCVSLYDSNGAMLDKDFVNPLFQESGGVRFDRDHNVYVGGFILAAGHRYPRFSTPDNSYLVYTGSVIKFPPEGGYTDETGGQGTLAATVRKVYNAIRVYPDGFGPFSGTAGGDGCCTCRSPRFDVDLYGRLFTPDAMACRVSITDNNANVIAYFGEYGNADSRGLYSAMPNPAIPLAFPVGAGASEDFVYVTDMYNNRVVQARMNYALDNIPGLTDHGVGVANVGAPTRGAPTLVAAPNPFNPAVTFTLSGMDGKRVSLKVFDMSGRLAADLSGNLRSGRAVWNAQGHASGMYVATARAGARQLTMKIILSK